MTKIKNNKYTILFLLSFLILITWCGLNTFVINDDLPYSLFYRSNVRITSIMQIIRNQASDYLTINGRFFVHFIVQFVLIFEKKLFSFLNAICIVITLFFGKKIISLENKNFKEIFVYFILAGLFLLLGNYKYLIYWVAGSVNYVWIYTLLIIYVYLYLKNGLKNSFKVNSLFIFTLSILHECSFVFILFLIIFDFVKNIILKEKINWKMYVKYLIISIIGGSIVLFAPGNSLRMLESKQWYSMTLLNRLLISIPVVSKNLFNLIQVDNIIPLIFVITLLIVNVLRKNKINYIFSLLLIPCCILCVIYDNEWIYFVLSIIIILNIIYDNYKMGDNKKTVVWLSFYAVVFSMIITPEYAAARPNYYIYIWMIIAIINNLLVIVNKKSLEYLIYFISIILVIFTFYREYNIYYNIGKVIKERKKSIYLVRKNNLKVLRYKMIDNKYVKYHPDANDPVDESYWAYKYFLYYYELPDGLKIKIIK